MQNRVIELIHESSRRIAQRYIQDAPDSWVMCLTPPEKTRRQENHYHALIRHVAHFDTFAGHRRDVDTWKRILVDEFVHDKEYWDGPPAGHGSLLPSRDGLRVIQLGVPTRDFKKPEAANFVTFLLAYLHHQNLPPWKRRQ
jgi:hypothetical protein